MSLKGRLPTIHYQRSPDPDAPFDFRERALNIIELCRAYGCDTSISMPSYEDSYRMSRRFLEDPEERGLPIEIAKVLEDAFAAGVRRGREQAAAGNAGSGDFADAVAFSAMMLHADGLSPQAARAMVQAIQLAPLARGPVCPVITEAELKDGTKIELQVGLATPPAPAAPKKRAPLAAPGVSVQEVPVLLIDEEDKSER